MASTNHYGWPYPVASDPPQGDQQIAAVATGVDATLYQIESGKIPMDVIQWTNLTATGTGISVRNRLRVMRHSTGQIEFQVSLNIADGDSSGVSPSNNQVCCTLPDWARFNGSDILLPLATNNTAQAKAYLSTGSDGECTLALSMIANLSGRFVEGVLHWTP